MNVPYEVLCQQAREQLKNKPFAWVMKVVNYRTGTERTVVGAGDSWPTEGQAGRSLEARFVLARFSR